MSEPVDVRATTHLEVIEVPPELRGLSDEEIISRSEKVLREVSGKRKKGERRPSKRVRLALKEQKAQAEAKAMFDLKPIADEVMEIAAPKPPVPTTPASGRVLKASFGARSGDKPKAVIVSAAELALQKAEERAKKIREALFAKRAATSAPIANSTDEQPVKRPRGRPRKNPID